MPFGEGKPRSDVLLAEKKGANWLYTGKSKKGKTLHSLHEQVCSESDLNGLYLAHAWLTRSVQLY